MHGPRRTANLHARVRPRERELIEAAARVRGVHLSELVREGAIREARRALVGEHALTEYDDG